MNFQPGYIKLHQNGTLQERANIAKKHLTKCTLCPHECGVNRTKNVGFCQATDQALVSSYGPHFGEEPELVGINGSGTIFFGYCNMRCIFCQNFELSFGGEGNLISNDSLANIMISLQNDYQIGWLKVDDRGIAFQGLIIRHLMMPGGLSETKLILEFIADNLNKDTLINIMDQYYPTHQAHKYKEINQPVKAQDWKEALSFANKLGLRTVL